MLTELSIRDVALFERAELCFGSGLNVITGETGAGKSLLIGALELLLGRKPKSGLLRKGAREARVEGRFCFAPGAVPARLAEWLREHFPDAQADPDEELELILSRRLGAEGRTRAHLNHRPVTRTLLRELASLLVEIHGQNDHQKLLDPSEQLRLLDTYGEHEELLGDYREKRRQWIELEERLRAWVEEERERTDRLELLRFQVEELESAELSVEEERGLRSERDLLRHGEELATEVGGLLESLTDGDGAALDRMRQGERVLGAWEERVEALSGPAGELREAAAYLELASTRLRSFVDGLEYSPDRMELVEERLGEYARFESRHHLGLEELLARLPGWREELDQLEEDAQGLDELAARSARALAALEKSAARLRRARKKLATKLKREVQRGLKELGLERAEFEVRVEARDARANSSPNADPKRAEGCATRRQYGPEGADSVEYFLAANPGEGFEALRKVASGGEAARIMLALRGALAARQTIPALIFDEVDAGVGGRLAPKVGEHLGLLGQHAQILCITHLPAVAALADRHLKVCKDQLEGRTRTSVSLLDEEQRIGEIADMIAGGADHESARAEARRLLEAR